MDKRELLLNTLEQYRDGGICLAFSGGVDSALLLRMCRALSIDVLAVTFQTTLHPQCDLQNAKEVAAACGANWQVITVDEWSIPQILNNPPDRCYHCKHHLFTQLAAVAEKHGLKTLMDGTNADDLTEYRPGLRALRELSVVSPLALCGLTKADVRALAKDYGMEVAARPSTPCLATRLPYGAALSRELLRKIEQGEEHLRARGFSALRLRVHPTDAGLIARIELPPADFSRALTQADNITEALQTLGFTFITLDLMGLRSGSYDRRTEQEVTL